jgi:hypothetical protein
MSIKSESILGKKVMCEDLAVGKVKEIIIDASKMKITHLEVELTSDAAEIALGVRKGGIINLLAISALDSIGKTINLKVTKGQLHIYLQAPKLEN